MNDAVKHLNPESIPLALYVHLPWCIKKCPYCDFNSHEQKTDTDFATYTDAVLNDLNWELEQHQSLSQNHRKISSIFFGGGTPSLFPAKQILRILRHAKALFGFSNNIEITLEANPGAIDQARFDQFRAAGVNRLSIGVQSFNNNHLTALGRIHDSSQAQNAFTCAREAGFENINLDLMFGLPEQSIAQAAQDIDKAIELAPEHISAYQLTLEANTLFHKFPPALPDEDTLSDMQQQIVTRLFDNGYARYEVSAYARESKQCVHNKNYWLFGDYIGVGAGAHGKQTRSGCILRRSKSKHPTRYIKQWQNNSTIAIETNERILDAGETVFEFMLNALRLSDGFSYACFEQNTGLSITSIDKKITELVKQNFLENKTHRIKTSDNGFLFLNEVLQNFLPDTPTNDTVSARIHAEAISR
ncbi:MAG: radical SAM family heme chaperone HemW [Arenicellales bacterium WSBS_2016_MAG_OTU3]